MLLTIHSSSSLLFQQVDKSDTSLDKFIISQDVLPQISSDLMEFSKPNADMFVLVTLCGVCSNRPIHINKNIKSNLSYF